jgi:hypothetical protein
MPPPDNVIDINRWRQRRGHKREEQESRKEQILHKYIPDGENILAVKRLTWLMMLGEFLKAACGSLLPVVAAIALPLWGAYLPLWVVYYVLSIYLVVRWMAKRHKHIHIKPFTTLVILGVYALALYALVKTYTRPVLLGSLLIVWVLLWTRYAEKYEVWKESYYILTDRQLWRIYLQIQGVHARWRYPSTDLRAASYSDPEITAWYAFLGWIFRIPHVGFFRLGTAVQEDQPLHKFGPTDNVHEFNILFKEARAALMGNAPPMVPPI